MCIYFDFVDQQKKYWDAVADLKFCTFEEYQYILCHFHLFLLELLQILQ